MSNQGKVFLEPKTRPPAPVAQWTERRSSKRANRAGFSAVQSQICGSRERLKRACPRHESTPTGQRKRLAARTIKECSRDPLTAGPGMCSLWSVSKLTGIRDAECALWPRGAGRTPAKCAAKGPSPATRASFEDVLRGAVSFGMESTPDALAPRLCPIARRSQLDIYAGCRLWF